MIGNRLKTKRKKNKITQKALAQKIGVKPIDLSAYEHGKQIPPTDIQIKISKALNVSLDYLIGTSDIAHPPITGKRVIEINKNITTKEFEELKKIVLQLIERKQILYAKEALAKQEPALVKTAVVFEKEGACFQCPHCKTTMEREYQQYCDRCGQKLKWQARRKVHYIYL